MQTEATPMKTIFLFLLMLPLAACGIHSEVASTPLGDVATVEINGHSGSREITCIGKTIHGKFVYKPEDCQTSTRHSIGHSAAVAAIHAGSILGSARILSHVDGGDITVHGSKALANSSSNAKASASSKVDVDVSPKGHHAPKPHHGW